MSVFKYFLGYCPPFENVPTKLPLTRGNETLAIPCHLAGVLPVFGNFSEIGSAAAESCSRSVNNYNPLKAPPVPGERNGKRIRNRG